MTARRRHIQLLRSVYEQGGFIRIKMDRRRQGVRTGWELRLPTTDQVDLATLVASLAELEIGWGKPYRKGRQQIIPIYGRDQIQRFLQLIRPALKDVIPKLPDRRDLRFKRSSRSR